MKENFVQCIVFTSALKDKVSYIGNFYGFFQIGFGDIDDGLEVYPVAVICKKDGTVKEVMTDRISFDTTAEVSSLLIGLPEYRGRRK